MCPWNDGKHGLKSSQEVLVIVTSKRCRRFSTVKYLLIQNELDEATRKRHSHATHAPPMPRREQRVIDDFHDSTPRFISLSTLSKRRAAGSRLQPSTAFRETKKNVSVYVQISLILPNSLLTFWQRILKLLYFYPYRCLPLRMFPIPERSSSTAVTDSNSTASGQSDSCLVLFLDFLRLDCGRKSSLFRSTSHGVPQGLKVLFSCTANRTLACSLLDHGMIATSNELMISYNHTFARSLKAHSQCFLIFSLEGSLSKTRV